MGRIFKINGAFVLILASALLWANIAWAVPWNRLNEELEATVTEELPIIEYDPLTYAQITYDELLAGISDVAAVGETWPCVNCGHVNPPDAKYCSQCGTNKGTGASDAGLTYARVCPKCSFVNEKEAKFCGDCGYGFSAVGARTAELELVYVPGRGYLPKGTMIEPGHARTAMWVTGLVTWLLTGPGITALGISENSKPIYIAGGVMCLGGLVLFIVGLAVKTEPVYASRPGQDDDTQIRLACARRSLGREGLAVKTDVPLFSF